ncbi:hypothetical protein GHH_c31900 [Geobacillus sp. GHH01]|nr:hypothetical protein GHH_c31900 [Geobacillus sp. GHH01]
MNFGMIWISSRRTIYKMSAYIHTKTGFNIDDSLHFFHTKTVLKSRNDLFLRSPAVSVNRNASFVFEQSRRWTVLLLIPYNARKNSSKQPFFPFDLWVHKSQQ